MSHRCRICDLEFEREQGYWTGAMLINWVLVSFSLGPFWILLMIRGVPFVVTFFLTFGLLIVLLPIFFRYSRIIWLYLDHAVDTGRK